MKKQLLFLYFIILFFIMPFPIYAKDFPDTKDHWAKEYIQWAADEGIIHGYPNGKFLPDEKVTQGEFYKMVNGFGKFINTAPIHFKDVKENQWYYKEIAIGVGTGYLKDSTEDLEANKELLRNEGARIISYIYDLKKQSNDVSRFSDSPLIVNPESVGPLINLKILNGYPDGTFRPLKGITRGEVAKILFLCKEKLGLPHSPKEEVIGSPDYLRKDPRLETEVMELPEFYFHNLPTPKPVNEKTDPKAELHYLGWMFESKIVLPAQVPEGCPEEKIKEILNHHFGKENKVPIIEFFFYEGGNTYSVKAEVKDWILQKDPVTTETGPKFMAFPIYHIEGHLPIEKKDIFVMYIFLPSMPPSP